jgi:hypothetical protein
MKFTKLERRWAADVLSGFAPPSGPGLVPRAGEVDWVDVVTRIHAASTPLARLGSRLALWIAVFAPLWMCGRLALMGSLPLEERARIINRLLEHRVYFVRELTVLLKIAASFALLGCASVRARSGYDRIPETQIRLRAQPSRSWP